MSFYDIALSIEEALISGEFPWLVSISTIRKAFDMVPRNIIFHLAFSTGFFSQPLLQVMKKHVC